MCTQNGQEYRYSWGHSGSTPNCVAFERSGSDAATTYSFVSTEGCVAHVAPWSKRGQAGPSTATTLTLNMTATVQGVVRSD